MLPPIFGAGFMGGQGASFTPDLSGGNAAPSSAGSGLGGVSVGGFDSSGWTVATGSAKASATNAKNDPTASTLQAIPWVVVAAALVAAVAVWKLA